MTAKSPEVIYLIDTGDGVAWCGDPDPTGYGECDDAVKYVLGDAYEALQAECEELQRALSESRANDLTAMGYLNQIRQLVGGDDFPDMVRRCERLQAKCARLQAAMTEAKSYIEHYMYGGSSYREPAAEAIAIIDAAMQEARA